MKLLVKLPQNKPPFIGILLPKTFDAGKLNQDLVLQHKSLKYEILLEFHASTLNLHLHAYQQMISRTYRSLDYDRQKLKTWLQLTKGADSINFGHVIREENQDKVVKTWDRQQLYVLKVGSCRIMSAESMD